LVKHNLAN